MQEQRLVELGGRLPTLERQMENATPGQGTVPGEPLQALAIARGYADVGFMKRPN